MFLLMVFCIATTLTGSGGKSEFFFLTTITSNFLTPVEYPASFSYVRLPLLAVLVVLELYLLIVRLFISLLYEAYTSSFSFPYDLLYYRLSFRVSISFYSICYFSLLQVRCYSTKPSTDSSGQNSEDPEVNRKPKKRLTRAEKAGFSVPEDLQENNYRNDSQRWLARTNG